MFWKFSGYANISPIDAIFDRPEFTLDDLLDESELLSDVKAHHAKLIEYITRREAIEQLMDYVVAPKQEPQEALPRDSAEPASSDAPAERGRSRKLPFGRSRASSSATDGGIDEEDETESKRTRYAFVACEILSSDVWAISEIITDPENRPLLRKFWEFLKKPAPLDPLQASYFTKVNESLFDRKVDDMVDFLKTADHAVQDMLRHVDCPMIMDLLLKIIALDRPDMYQGIAEWLYTQDIIPTLLSFLGPGNSWSTQTSAGDFIKAIITVSANATQHEQTCIGPNELTRQLVSHPCIDNLIGYMLKGGNALTVGVGIVIEVIRKNNSDYDPDVGSEANSIPSSRDPIYLGTLLRMFAQNVPNFMQLMNNAPAQKIRLNSTFGEKIEPLGFDRFKTCELMAELLHCSNMSLLNEPWSEGLIAVRDAERRRLRSEGRLTPNRGEEAATPTSADVLTMSMAHTSTANESRRLEVTNVSAADDDGFEEVTHAVDLGSKHASSGGPSLPSRPSSSVPAVTDAFSETDDDEFVEEPLSSPRLKTNDENADRRFDDPDLVVAPLSPNKKKTTLAETNADDTQESSSSLLPMKDSVDDAAKGEEQSDRMDDFVTEATEPALGNEAKRMVPDLEKGDDSDSSFIFTPTISSLSESLDLKPGSTESLGGAFGDNLPDSAEDSKSDNAHNMSEEATAVSESGTKQPGEDEAPVMAASAEEHSSTVDDAETEFGDASMIVTYQPSESAVPPPKSPADARFPNPVVGDFLKMQFVDHRVVPTILSFFFSYPWNNFLHNVVYDVVQQVFNGPMDRGFNPHLAISLFESADITTQIVNGQLVSEQSQAATRMRMGYMGHLTLIAEEVVKFTERHPAELLSEIVVAKIMSPDWTNYIDGTLAETRERDNATLGGVRPEVAMGNHAAAAGLAAVGLSGLGSTLGLTGSQGKSNALAEAGLNGGLDLQSNSGLELQGSGNDAGPFSISAGISSGFHSSSDEEDDDADDNDEDINNEFRAYTDPLNSASGVLPPSIPPPPPPPPPLNVPPSRARQLLAARLAMNKRNAEFAAAQEIGNGAGESGNTEESGDLALQGQGSSGGGSDAASKLLSSMLEANNGSERIQNPFADDDDDDVGAENDYDEDDDDDEDAGLNGGEVGQVGIGWNRGSWWRSMVRRDRKGKISTNDDGRTDVSSGGAGSANDMVGAFDHEKFGDGRDSSSDESDNEAAGSGDNSSGEEEAPKRMHRPAPPIPGSSRSSFRHGPGAAHALDDADEDDEEFGDFAMPESSNDGSGETSLSTAPGNSGSGVQFDSENYQETVLFKPLALHPPAPSAPVLSSSSIGGGSLWRLGFLGSASTTGVANSTPTGVSDSNDDAKEKGDALPTPVMPTPDADDALEVLDEDGQRVVRVTEAKRRTSLEDADEDEVVV